MIKLVDFYKKGSLGPSIPVEEVPKVKQPPTLPTEETRLRESLRGKEKELLNQERQLAELARELERTRKDLEVKVEPALETEAAKLAEERRLRESLEEKLRGQERQLADYAKLQEELKKRSEAEAARLRVEEEARKATEKKLEEKEKEFKNSLRKLEISMREEEEKSRREEENVKNLEREAGSVPSEGKEEKPALGEESSPRISKISALIYQKGLGLIKEVIQKANKGVPFDCRELSRYAETLLDQINLDDNELLRLTIRSSSDGSVVDYFCYQAVNAAILAAEVGIGLQYETDLLQDLILAALLHDVGLTRVRDHIDSPRELDPEKKKEVMKHPLYSAEMLKGMGVRERVLSAILQHHERPDGKGYPHGILAPEITKLARVLQVVDAFEAATHSRPYHKGKSYADALKEVCEFSDEIYDGQVVRALMNRIGLYPLDVLVELTTSQIGRVIAQNHNFPMRPVVRLEFDAKGNRLEEYQVLDLREQPSVHIVGVVKDIESFSKISKEVKKESKRKLSFLDILIPIGGTIVILALISFLLRL